MAKTGRKTKLTRELIQEAKRLRSIPQFIEPICNQLGIHVSTWHKWKQEGAKEEKGLKREFFDAIKEAEGIGETNLVNEIKEIGITHGKWQALAWILQHMYPDRYGKKETQVLEHSGRDGKPIETSHTQEIDLSNLTDGELDQLERIINKTQIDK